MERKAKILLYDLEVSPLLGWTYQMWDARVIKLEDRQRLMSFSYQWYGEKKIHCETLEMQDTYKVDPKNDYLITKKLHDLMNEADIIIAHNGDRFDNKVSNTFFIFNGLTPVAPYKSIDTLKIARRHFKFAGNSLNALGDYLGVGQKTSVTHGDIWYDCYMNGTPKAWKQMAKYNNQDVELLRKVYEVLRPYMSNHPNLLRYENKSEGCPKCGGENLQSRGYYVTAACKYRRYRCNDCGGWSSRRIAVEKEYDVKPSYKSI